MYDAETGKCPREASIVDIDNEWNLTTVSICETLSCHWRDSWILKTSQPLLIQEMLRGFASLYLKLVRPLHLRAVFDVSLVNHVGIS